VKLEELERQAIEAALRKSDQNVTEAAKLLGISRRTLHRKLADAKKG
jgi:DNA-binding NtrC family response regulator